MSKLKNLSLNGLQLKLIGWLFTLCFAASILLFPMDSAGTAKIILTYLGYISLPIFAFLLVKGFENCRKLHVYLLTLVAAAVITEPFYDYFCTGYWLDIMGQSGQNILFAMIIGLMELYFLRYMGTASAPRTLASIFMVICSGVWTIILNIPFGFYFAAMVGVFYLLRDKKWVMLTVAAVLSLVFLISPVVGVGVLCFYNGERGKYSKFWFYALYPAVWILAALAKLLLA